jgi:hypothetical protein
MNNFKIISKDTSTVEEYPKNENYYYEVLQNQSTYQTAK